MNEILAYCGLVCERCLIHLATFEPNGTVQNEMRVKIANELAKIYGTSPKPEVITDCDGCMIKNGRLFTGCIDCSIRTCAISNNLSNCAYCDDFACEKLEKYYSFDQDSRKRLEEIRKNFLATN